MSEYLENLKSDLAEALKRLQEAQIEAQRVNTVFQTAHADVQALQRVVENQTRKEQQDQPSGVLVTAVGPVAATIPVITESQVSPPEINKTKLIRQVLGQHAGMTPGELFEAVKAHIGQTYVYSVLKRLRDREEVIVRRKKYYLRETPKAEEGKQHSVVQ